MLKRFTGFMGTLAGLTLMGVMMAGCSGNTPPLNTLEEELVLKNQQIEQLQSEMDQQREATEVARKAAEKAENQARDTQRTYDELRADQGSGSKTGSTSGDLLPSGAQPGECFARVLVPEVYDSTTEEVLVRQASHRIEIIPARYEFVEEKIVKKEGSQRIEVVPATYEWVEEKVLVEPASKKLVEVPAQYETVTEEVLVTPARTYWKKGRGPVERVDNATGEIMCLVEEPAVYNTVTRREVKTPATTREVEIPAKYNTVKRQVLKTPAKTRTIDIPAEYETVKVRKLVEPSREKRIAIPAEYKTVTKRKMTKESYLEWRPVVCETNMTTEGIRDLQRALKGAGHDPGPIDGIYGRQTQAAVRSFQTSKGLATGGLTHATVKALNVKFRSGN